MGLADRVLGVLGVTARPAEAWMLQIGRNLIVLETGALGEKCCLVIDRDTKYAVRFRRLIRESGTEVICLPPMSPNLNAYDERLARTKKRT